MIDKIKCYTDKFIVKRDAPLSIVPHAVSFATGEVENSSTVFMSGLKLVAGQKAYANVNGISFKIEMNKLWIEFNPGSLINGHNFHLVNHTELILSLEIVERTLDEIRIVADLDMCKFSRLDLAMNIETQQEFESYKLPLKFIKPRFMPGKVAEFREGSYLIKNRSRQYSLYDKLGQMQSKGIDTKDLGNSNNFILRAEIGLLNKRSIKNTLDLDVVGDLRELATFERLSKLYSHIMNNDFFMHKSVSNQLNAFDNDLDLLNYFKRTYPRGAVDRFLLHKFMTGREPYDTDLLVELMLEVGYSRSSTFEKKKTLLDLQCLANFSDDPPSNLNGLLQELQSKLTS